MKDCTENKLSKMAREETANKAKALSEEEILIILENIPSRFMFDELKRRDEINSKILNDVRKTLKGENTDDYYRF